jgi:hypothetical protein
VKWCGAYHVEGHDILEGDLAGAVTLDEDLVDELRAAASWQTEDERVLRGWLECLDAAWMKLEYVYWGSRSLALTNDIVCNVHRCRARVLSDNDTPVESGQRCDAIYRYMHMHMYLSRT